jgi:YD repeat-containing protein
MQETGSSLGRDAPDLARVLRDGAVGRERAHAGDVADRRGRPIVRRGEHSVDPLLRETRIEPDGLGRPVRVIEPDVDGNPLTLGDQPTWNYSYGDNSLLLSVTDPLNRVSNYEYDDFGRKKKKRPH